MSPIRFTNDRDGRRRNSTLNAGRGFSASPAQRAKIAGLVSIVSGQGPCDPCHLWPRGLGGCDDALCVIPLTRLEHEAFDRGELSILAELVANGYWAELAHAVSEHRVDPISLLQRCDGQRWIPEPRTEGGRA